MVVYSCKKCGELNYLTPHAFWNISDFGARCERCATINTITLEMGELKKTGIVKIYLCSDLQSGRVNIFLINSRTDNIESTSSMLLTNLASCNASLTSFVPISCHTTEAILTAISLFSFYSISYQ
jgi:hypothetical protein